MEYVSGTKITTLSPVALLELNGAALAEQLFRAYLKQILVDGFFHADPHPGNVLVTDAGQIALLDLGWSGGSLPACRSPSCSSSSPSARATATTRWASR